MRFLSKTGIKTIIYQLTRLEHEMRLKKSVIDSPSYHIRSKKKENNYCH